MPLISQQDPTINTFELQRQMGDEICCNFVRVDRPAMLRQRELQSCSPFLMGLWGLYLYLSLYIYIYV